MIPSSDPAVQPTSESSPYAPANANDAGVHPASDPANANTHSTHHPATVNDDVTIPSLDGDAHILAPPTRTNANAGGSSIDASTSADTDSAMGNRFFVNLVTRSLGPLLVPQHEAKLLLVRGFCVGQWLANLVSTAATMTKTAKQVKK
ncbi:hypothetical protein B0H14DRAFT_2565103 [Mycena olivaceomarginata]|nr:hypothetical protein B0H14DRAFT_2565103 [Mycena olivaceomarginata]